MCVCSLLLGNSNFEDSLSTNGLGDCKVARVGRPATDYKLVVRPWERLVAFDHASYATFPRFDNYYVHSCMACVCGCVHACMCVCVYVCFLLGVQ